MGIRTHRPTTQRCFSTIWQILRPEQRSSSSNAAFPIGGAVVIGKTARQPDLLFYAAVRFTFAALWFVGLVSGDALHDTVTLQPLIRVHRQAKTSPWITQRGLQHHESVKPRRVANGGKALAQRARGPSPLGVAGDLVECSVRRVSPLSVRCVLVERSSNKRPLICASPRNGCSHATVIARTGLRAERLQSRSRRQHDWCTGSLPVKI